MSPINAGGIVPGAGASGSGTFTALSGDATSTSTGGATTVTGVNGVPVSAAQSALINPTTALFMNTTFG